LVASLARAARLEPTLDLIGFLAFFAESLGEPLYQARPPTGYPDDSDHWSTGGTLITRFNTVAQLAAADALLGIDWGVEGGPTPELVDALAARLLPRLPDARTRRETIEHVDGLGVIPDAQRVREAATLLLSSPDFLRH
jgi:hypothetical protein